MADDLAHPFEQLLRVVGVSGHGRPTEADRREVRRRLEAYATEQHDQTLEAVFGLYPRGRLSARQAWRHDRRDQLIRELAQHLDDGTVSRRQLAQDVDRFLRDYERTKWRADQRRSQPCELSAAGRLRFAILSVGLPLPANERTIRRIIS